MNKPLALGFLAASSFLILAASLLGGSAAAIVFAFLAVGFPVGLMLMGVERCGRVGPAGLPILIALAFLVLTLTGLLALQGPTAVGPRVLGLPIAVALQLVGLLAAPLVVVALGFAWTFRSFSPAPEDVARLRDMAPERTDS